MPYIDFAIHLHDRGGGSRARRCTKIGSEAFGGTRIAGKARRPHIDTDTLWRAPIAFDIFEEALPSLVVPADRIVGCPTALRIGAVQDQRRCALGIRRSVEQGHRPALRYPEQGRPL